MWQTRNFNDCRYEYKYLLKSCPSLPSSPSHLSSTSQDKSLLSTPLSYLTPLMIMKLTFCLAVATCASLGTASRAVEKRQEPVIDPLCATPYVSYISIISWLHLGLIRLETNSCSFSMADIRDLPTHLYLHQRAQVIRSRLLPGFHRRSWMLCWNRVSYSQWCGYVSEYCWRVRHRICLVSLPLIIL